MKGPGKRGTMPQKIGNQGTLKIDQMEEGLSPLRLNRDKPAQK